MSPAQSRRLVSTVGRADSPVFQRLHAAAAARADQIGLDYEWRPRDADAPAASLLDGAYAAIVDTEPYDAMTLERIADETRLLVRFGVGYDSVDVAAATRLGIKVGRTPGGNAAAVAEMALLLMLATRRKLDTHSISVRSGAFRSEVSPGLIGATVGIVGYGAVGRSVHRLLKGFGCEVLVQAPRMSPSDAQDHGVELASLEEIARRADVLTLHVPATPETRGMISRDVLRMMKPTATIINTSRGSVVDEVALCEALTEGWIGSAGLDVFAEEPLPRSSPLLAAPNLVVTPHSASQTEPALSAMFDMALDVVDDVLASGQSPHLLNH